MSAWLTNLWYKIVYNQKLLFGYFKNPPVNGIQKGGYNLVFSDEFTAPIDWNKWSEIEPWEYINPKGIRFKSQVTQSGSSVFIKSERVNGKLKTAILDTGKSFIVKYCWAEVRMKVMPNTGKFWPAFWSYDPTGWLPEVDISEFETGDGSYYTVTQHDREYAPGKHKSRGTRLSGINFPAGFHTFALEWTSSKLVWYLDNVPVFMSDTNIPDVPFHFIISNGGRDEVPDKDYPAILEVDYIRIYTPQ